MATDKTELTELKASASKGPIESRLIAMDALITQHSDDKKVMAWVVGRLAKEPSASFFDQVVRDENRRSKLPLSDIYSRRVLECKNAKARRVALLKAFEFAEDPLPLFRHIILEDPDPHARSDAMSILAANGADRFPAEILELVETLGPRTYDTGGVFSKGLIVGLKTLPFTSELHKLVVRWYKEPPASISQVALYGVMSAHRAEFKHLQPLILEQIQSMIEEVIQHRAIEQLPASATLTGVEIDLAEYEMTPRVHAHYTLPVRSYGQLGASIGAAIDAFSDDLNFIQRCIEMAKASADYETVRAAFIRTTWSEVEPDFRRQLLQAVFENGEYTALLRLEALGMLFGSAREEFGLTAEDVERYALEVASKDDGVFGKLARNWISALAIRAGLERELVTLTFVEETPKPVVEPMPEGVQLPIIDAVTGHLTKTLSKRCRETFANDFAEAQRDPVRFWETLFETFEGDELMPVSPFVVQDIKDTGETEQRIDRLIKAFKIKHDFPVFSQAEDWEDSVEEQYQRFIRSLNDTNYQFLALDFDDDTFYGVLLQRSDVEKFSDACQRISGDDGLPTIRQ